MPDRSPKRPATRSAAGSRRSDLALGLSAGALAVAAAVLGHDLAEADRGLYAWSGGSIAQDTDGDGLTDDQEEILASNPLVADTDADGIPDREEVARGSDPLEPASLPSAATHGVGLVGVVHDATLRLEVLAFVPGPASNLFDTKLHFGVHVAGQWIELPLATLLKVSKVTIEDAAGGEGLVVGIESGWATNLVAAAGPVGFWAAIGPLEGPPTAGGALQLVSSAGVLNRVQASQTVGSQGAGAAYRPIVPAEQLPSTYSQGQLCVQDLSLTGSEPALTIYEVQSANCEPADAYCSPDCSATAGQTVEVLDPLALLGG